MKSKRLIPIVLVLLAFGSLLAIALRNHWFVMPRADYEVELTCTSLPADDSQFESWLFDHPGWRHPTVSRYGNKVSIRFADEQPADPKVLWDLVGACDRLGYKVRPPYVGTMTDRSQRGTDWHAFWVQYGQLPPDDTAAAAWLASQTQVSRATAARHGDTVLFQFQLASPPPPAILAEIVQKCGELGYQEQKGSISAFGKYQ